MVMAADQSDLLKLGVYTRQHAAYLARLRPQTAARWFVDDEDARPAIHRQMPDNRDDLVSFVDLIQLLGVAEIRRARQLSLQMIRRVIEEARSKYNIDYPLARADVKVSLFGNTVVLTLPNQDLVEVSGQTKRHYLMQPVVLPYLQDLRFGPDQLPDQYRPLPGILLTPAREWGAPVLEDSGYTVETLVRAVRAEGSIEAAADMCGVAVQEVRTALRYDSFLAGVAG